MFESSRFCLKMDSFGMPTEEWSDLDAFLAERDDTAVTDESPPQNPPTEVTASAGPGLQGLQTAAVEPGKRRGVPVAELDFRTLKTAKQEGDVELDSDRREPAIDVVKIDSAIADAVLASAEAAVAKAIQQGCAFVWSCGRPIGQLATAMLERRIGLLMGSSSSSSSSSSSGAGGAGVSTAIRGGATTLSILRVRDTGLDHNAVAVILDAAVAATGLSRHKVIVSGLMAGNKWKKQLVECGRR